MSSRWGFEEDEDDVDTSLLGEPEEQDDEPIQGSDPDRLVTITVTDDAKPVAVALAPDWRTTSQPSALSTAVISAMSTATSMAMVRQAKRLNRGDDPSGTLAASTTSQPRPPETPITKEDVVRLLDAVTEDLDRFMQQAKDIAERQVTVESGGGHVRVSGRARRIDEMPVDPTWAGAVTLVGIPAAVVALTATIATSINLIATAVQERDASEDTIATEQDGIRQGVHNLGDEWRKSKHDLGDPGDWQPR